METRFKYPKTLHFPWSPGLQNDDRMMPIEDVIENFSGKNIVISEKLDGENTSMYSDYIHARSIYASDHPSRSWVKDNVWGRIKHDIPKDWRICGENVFAHHSIFYDNLEAYFYVFAIYTDQNICLDWNSTLEWCDLLGLTIVPHDIGQWNLRVIQNYQLDDNEEGYVVRNMDAFHYDDFQKNVAKYVRRGHVQTDQHWMSKPMVRNLLKNGGY